MLGYRVGLNKYQIAFHYIWSLQVRSETSKWHCPLPENLSFPPARVPQDNHFFKLSGSEPSRVEIHCSHSHFLLIFTDGETEALRE